MKKMNIAVVGLNFGSWMIEHELLREPAQSYLQIVAVCDTNEEKARTWGETLQVPYFTEIAEALAVPELEAVALFSGPIGRASLIDSIIEAGKHVITTKPFEANSLHAQHVLAKARSLGKVIHLNSPSPVLTPDLLKVKQWIEHYDLGKAIAFRAETTCAYREKPDGSWYDDPALCPVAPITRIGVYLINDLIRFFGEVEQVQVQQSRLFTERPTVDNAQLNLQFKNGALGNIFASFCIDDQQYYKAAFTMNFERGTIYRNMIPMTRNRAENHNELQVIAVKDGVQVRDTFRSPIQEGYQWDIFYQTVRGLRQDDVHVHEDIVTGIRILELMKHANEGIS